MQDVPPQLQVAHKDLLGEQLAVKDVAANSTYFSQLTANPLFTAVPRVARHSR